MVNGKGEINCFLLGKDLAFIGQQLLLVSSEIYKFASIKHFSPRKLDLKITFLLLLISIRVSAKIVFRRMKS